MIIDLNDYNLNFAETSFEITQIKSNKLIKEIVKHSNESGRNFMIVPMSIYNILEVNKSFQFSSLDSLMDEDSLRHLGSINDVQVYLDLLSPSDLIILKYDKSVMRDNKIDALLNDEELKEEIEITVLNY